MADRYYEQMPNGQWIGIRRLSDQGEGYYQGQKPQRFDNVKNWIINHRQDLYNHNNDISNIREDVLNTRITEVQAGVGDSKNQVKRYLNSKSSALEPNGGVVSTGKDVSGLRRIGNIVDASSRNNSGITAVSGADDKRTNVYKKALAKKGWMTGKSGEYIYQTNPNQRWILEGLIKRGMLPAALGVLGLPSQMANFNEMAERFNKVGLSDYDTNASEVY